MYKYINFQNTLKGDKQAASIYLVYLFFYMVYPDILSAISPVCGVIVQAKMVSTSPQIA